MALCFLFVLSGCANLTIDNGSLTNHVQVNPVRGSEYNLKKTIEVERWNHYFVFQLVPEEHELESLIGPELDPGDIVTDLKIEKKTTFVNGLICALVGPIYCPDTLIITGNVYSATQAPIAK